MAVSWFADGRDIYLSPDVCVGKSFGDCPWNNISAEQSFRNARLMAAAPEMLTALKTAKEAGDLSGRAYTMVCEAIAKAEGAS